MAEPGRRRALPASSLLSLAVAVIAAGVLLVRAPEKAAGIARSTTRVTAAVAWPQAAPVQLPRRLADGTAPKPVLLVDARTALVVAPTPDGGHLRLLVQRAAGDAREVRRVPAGRAFPFGAFAASGGSVVWIEKEAGAAVALWTAEVHGLGAARRLAAITGTPDDLLVADGRARWTVPADDGRTTELRSVGLADGAAETSRMDGAWTLSTWPWLRERRDGGVVSARLRNVRTGQDVRVQTSEDDLVTCGPVWCRVLMLRPWGPARIDIMRVDGSDRRTINDTGADAATDEVALADRYVVVTEPEPNAPLTGSVTLLVHDIDARHTVVVDTGVTRVYADGPVLWWSTGTDRSPRWKVLGLPA